MLCTTPAAPTIPTALTLDPKNTFALQLRDKILELETHLRNFETARTRKDWGMARLALDKCLQGIEGEGGDIPTEWRLWRVELELARGGWDAANMAAR
jgi:DnaJ family protein C protein 7